jgi:hypothetical protein
LFFEGVFNVTNTLAVNSGDGWLPAGGFLPFEGNSGELMMDPKCKPRGRKAERNILCTYYGDCLDCAVRNAWENWSCSKCKLRDDEGSAPETACHVNHAIPFYDLETKT